MVVLSAGPAQRVVKPACFQEVMEPFQACEASIGVVRMAQLDAPKRIMEFSGTIGRRPAEIKIRKSARELTKVCFIGPLIRAAGGLDFKFTVWHDL
jgi:hypothetical protein